MELQNIESALSTPPENFPREALEAAIAQPGAVTPMLLQALETAVAEPDILDDVSGQYMMTLYAMHLLGQFREPAAYPLLVRLFSLERDWQEHFVDDVISDNLPRLFASLCGDDLAPLQSIVENPALNKFVRIAALEALAIRVLMGLLEREWVVDYFRALLNGKLERDALGVRTFLIINALRIHPGGLMPEIRRAYDDHLVEAFFIGLKELEEASTTEPETIQAKFRHQVEELFDDTVGELGALPYFEDNRPAEKPAPATRAPSISRDRYLEPPRIVRSGPDPARAKKVGRNDPCPCGSGKKYKKCCLNKES